MDFFFIIIGVRAANLRKIMKTLNNFIMCDNIEAVSFRQITKGQITEK